MTATTTARKSGFNVHHAVLGNGRVLCGRRSNQTHSLVGVAVADLEKWDEAYLCKRCAAKLAAMRESSARKAARGAG